MNNQELHINEVRNILQRNGLELVDLGLITNRKSSYGTYVDINATITVMNSEHIMNVLSYHDICRYR